MGRTVAWTQWVIFGLVTFAQVKLHPPSFIMSSMHWAMTRLIFVPEVGKAGSNQLVFYNGKQFGHVTTLGIWHNQYWHWTWFSLVNDPLPCTSPLPCISQARGRETPLFPIYCYVAKLMIQNMPLRCENSWRCPCILIFLCLRFPQPPSLGKRHGNGDVHFAVLLIFPGSSYRFKKTHCHEPHPWNLAGNYASHKYIYIKFPHVISLLRVFLGIHWLDFCVRIHNYRACMLPTNQCVHKHGKKNADKEKFS